jgi:hypothetical protein
MHHLSKPSKPKPAVSTLTPPPGPLAIPRPPSFPNQESSTFYRLLLHFVRLGRIASSTHACMPRRAERTTPSTPLHLPLPSLSALIQAINSHREIPSIIHALAPMTRLSLATPVNAVPSTDYYSSLQSFTRWPSCPYMSENSHRVGLGRPRGWYREHNEIDFPSMPKEGPPDLQRSGI